jgi:hypothetical protein
MKRATRRRKAPRRKNRTLRGGANPEPEQMTIGQLIKKLDRYSHAKHVFCSEAGPFGDIHKVYDVDQDEDGKVIIQY